MTLEECKNEVDGWLNLKLTSGRYSSLLAKQLACHMANRTLDVFTIYNEIGWMEGAPLTRPTPTKAASLFTRNVLRGLWHKHYTTPAPASLMCNLVNHWTKKRITRLIADVEADTVIPESGSGDRPAHRLVIDGYRQRSRNKQMTGQWIVFAKHRGANVYLTLANHTEGDEAILARAELAAIEFPGLDWRGSEPTGSDS